jgi:DNA repair protein RadC
MGMILREAEVVYRPGKRIDAPRKVRSSYDASEVLKGYGLADKTQEHFVVLYLNSKHMILGVQTVAMGSLNEVTVHPREVFRGAIMAGAAAVIIAHNHPSGDTDPSTDDMRITQRMIEVGKLVGIPVLDHIVVGEPRHYSFAEDHPTIF